MVYSVFRQFPVFPISTHVDVAVYQHGKCFIFVKNNVFIFNVIIRRSVEYDFLYSPL